jgi:hypothetical protein
VTVRLPSRIRSTGDAIANPTSPSGRCGGPCPKGCQEGSSLGSAPPCPSLESAMGPTRTVPRAPRSRYTDRSDSTAAAEITVSAVGA